MSGYARGGVQLPFKASYPTLPAPPFANNTANLNTLYGAQTGYTNYSAYQAGQYLQGYPQRVPVPPHTVKDDYERVFLYILGAQSCTN